MTATLPRDQVYLGNPLLKKLQAVRQGGGSDIMASYDWRSDKSMRINKILNS